jgi:hypothetical protein
VTVLVHWCWHLAFRARDSDLRLSTGRPELATGSGRQVSELLGVLLGVCCRRSGCGRDGLGSLEGDWLDGQHVNVIESKFRRAIVRGKGGLEVGHNEHFLPLYERVDSPTLSLLDRELLQIAGLGHLRNGRVEVLARRDRFQVVHVSRDVCPSHLGLDVRRKTTFLSVK